jgi:hypothetical protein
MSQIVLLVLLLLVAATRCALWNYERTNDLIFNTNDQVKFPCTERTCEPSSKYKALAMDEPNNAVYLHLRSSSMIVQYNLTTHQLIRWQHFPQENIKIGGCFVPRIYQGYDLVCVQSRDLIDSDMIEYSLMTITHWNRTVKPYITVHKRKNVDFYVLDDADQLYLLRK